MDFIINSFIEAFRLIFALDQDVFNAVFISLKVSLTAIVLSSIVSLPLGFIIAEKNFVGKRLIIMILNTLMGVPTVVVGLLVYTFISRQGPLGMLNLLFTSKAMIIGQFILAFPILTSLTISAIQAVDERVAETALTLGANKRQLAYTVFLEARFGLLAAVISGFGRIIGEVGSAMILGGNIKGVTRTISTYIALQSSMGETERGIALGIILILMTFLINLLFNYFQHR
ncbi:TPA: ABC transporter permease subunit [Candidatus Poribacteria bacterium]|nr:ABC transporter permease subunit [Candidatus Poribacteria bacterium]